MTTRPQSSTNLILSVVKLIGLCILIPCFSVVINLAHANTDAPVASSIDELISSSNGLSKAQLNKQIKTEQTQLASQDRKQLKKLAQKGERLAQVVLGSDFANEAQKLLFAPAAANDALSDALQWYSLAAQRGFPGAPSLDNSGVSFYPVRVVRNK